TKKFLIFKKTEKKNGGIKPPCKYRFLLELYSPAADVVDSAPLNACQLVIELFGDRADISVSGYIVLAFIAYGAYGGDDGSGARTEYFFKLALIVSLDYFVNRELALGDLHSPVSQNIYAGFSRYSGEYGAVGGRGDDLAVYLEHDVHGTAFFNIFSLKAVEP